MKHSKTASLFRSLALIAGILIGGITAQAGTINENHNYLLHLLEYYNPTSFYIGDDTQQLFIGGSVMVKPFYNFRPTSGATGSSNPSDTPNYFFAPNAFDSDGNDGVYIPVDAVLSMVFHSDTPVGILDFALLVEYYSQGPDFDVNFDGLDAAFMRLQTHDSGVWIIGQTQSAFSNPAAWPETVEEEGPPAELFSWVPQVRWEATTGTTRWAVSVEAGDTDLNGCDAGCSVDNDIPDLVGTVAFYPKWGKAEFGAVLRTLKIHDTTNGSDTATGYGAAFSGYGNIPNGDMISYRLVGGVGLGHYMQDVVDMAGTVEADGNIDTFSSGGWYLSYTHNMSHDLSLAFTLSQTEVNTDVAGTYEGADYASILAQKEITPRFSTGVQLLWGKKYVYQASDVISSMLIFEAEANFF